MDSLINRLSIILADVTARDTEPVDQRSNPVRIFSWIGKQKKLPDLHVKVHRVDGSLNIGPHIVHSPSLVHRQRNGDDNDQSPEDQLLINR